jgi:Secretion system C-terminal sorting domain
MKKLLLSATFAAIWSLGASAQCTPDPQFTNPGVYPDSATGFESACVGVPYEQIITNVVPADSTVFIGPIPVTLVIDSVVVVSVTGLPPGFTFSCFDGQNVNSPFNGCAFEGGTAGCISIAGTPQAGDEGIYNLDVTFDLYLAGQPTPQFTTSIDYYSIEVIAAAICAAGMNDISTANFNLYPNPVSESFTLDGLEGLNISAISITNAEGKVLATYVDVPSSSFDMNVAHLDGGIYFVQIAHENYIDVVRFIKE